VSAADATDGAAATRALEAAAERLRVPARGLDRLAAYVAAVVDENTRINLTGAKTLDAALEVLAVDSMPLARAWPHGRAPRRVVDLGTGNGLPGVAAAVFWPEAEVVLVERREKKARAVERCLAAAGFAHVRVAACDGRELLRVRPDLARAVDLVTVRAVGDLAPTTREAAPWLARGGRIVHWKAGALDPAERVAGDEAARATGLSTEPDVEFELGSGAKRRLVVYAAR